MKFCKLCSEDGGNIIWKDDKYRFISLAEEGSIGVHRLIWNDHVKEMSHLSKENQIYIFKKLIKAEQFVLEKYNPHKINVASMGNLVPHLHWHVIPRWKTDPWWPNAIWSNLKKPKWSNTFVSDNSKKQSLICIADWTTLKPYLEVIRKEISLKKEVTPLGFDHSDFISRHAIIKMNDLPIGMGRLEGDGKISKIIVMNKFRRQGYGKKILRQIITEAKNIQLPSVFTNTKIKNKKFFLEEGFVPHGTEFIENNIKYQKMVKDMRN